jgi:hypothetical protein
VAVRQTRIYAPKVVPYDTPTWAETMMARVIRPMVQLQGMNWFWLTRYASETPEFADSDGSSVPAGFFDGQMCRSLRFRFDVDDDQRERFETRATTIINTEQCWIADWRPYGDDELCSDRFLGEDRSAIRKNERRAIVRNYLESVSRLALHALVPADETGRFRFETSDHPENPHGSAFFSLHHLFCNPTEVLLIVLVTSDGMNLTCGTRQYPPPILQGGSTVPLVEFKVRF